MERFVNAAKVVWRAERMLTQNEVRLGAKRVQLNAFAGLVGVFGLVMLSMSVFFALVPVWGEALAALAVGGSDIAIAAALVAYAGSLKPAPELEMIKQMRDLALSDIEEEAAVAEAELVALKNELYTFLRNPVDALLPSAIIPLLTAVTRGLRTKDK